ncbi:MAG: hypothetical protein NT154_11930 [Verrucomicrobia bacterium]|nr:hypothetical protein [Verrucomicrobiota bacterium]
MLYIRSSVLALAGLLVGSVVPAATVVEDFSANPLSQGWQVFGETNLFGWNSADRNLQVTWDSSRRNSYFYYSLGNQFTRYDDLSVEFDLRLSDIAGGAEPGKTAPLQIGFGFLDFADATTTNFIRSAWGGAPNVAEFDYYPSGYYEFGGYVWNIAPTMTPAFISGINNKHYAPTYLDAYEYEMPTNQTVHVRLNYDGLTQTAALELTTNGLPLATLPPLVLNNPTNSQFTPADDFHADTFSISSYSSADDVYSVLAHGTVDNLVVTAALRPIGRLSGAFSTNGVWQAQFFSRSNWLYTLECTTDFGSWTPVSPTLRGTDQDMILQDMNAVAARVYYRVRAE